MGSAGIPAFTPVQFGVKYDMDSRRPPTFFFLKDQGRWVDSKEGDCAQAVDVDALTQVHLILGRIPSLGGPAHRTDPLMTLRTHTTGL